MEYGSTRPASRAPGRRALGLSCFLVFGLGLAGCGGGGDAPPTGPTNQPPAASISAPADGDTLNEGDPITFRGSATDPEDGQVTGEDLVWESDEDGQFGTGEEVTTRSLSADEHTVTLTATDSEGATDRASIGITVQHRPSVSITSPSDGAEFGRSESITFRGSANDPEEGALTGDALVWRSRADGRFGTGEEVNTAALTPDRHTVTLTATDSLGASGSDSISVAVHGPPSATISSPGDESVFDEGTTLTLTGSGADPVNGELSGDALEWFSDVDGRLGAGDSVSYANPSAGPHTITLAVTDSAGNTTRDSARILLESPGFDFRLRLLSDFTSSERQTIRDALGPWEAALTGDLPPVFPPAQAAEDCSIEERGVDDLVLAVRARDLDGSGGVLAQAGPCLFRTEDGAGSTTSVAGIVTIDRADLGNPDLEQIVTHEVGHALAIGVLNARGWSTNVGGLGTRDPFFTGDNTVSAFEGVDGEAYLSDGVPLANTGGAGTAGAHWRELNFDAELMTGFINPGVDMPLSRVSIASLADIGYEVDLSAADPFSLPMPQVALWLAEADATLSDSASAGENFGTRDGAVLDTVLVAGSNNDQLWSTDPEDELFGALLRFGAPASLPAGVTVDSAAIRLTVAGRNAETSNHPVRVFPVTSGWSESDVTWDGRPSVRDSSVLAFDFEACSDCRLGSDDLTGLAVDWLDGTASNHGLFLWAPDATGDPTFSVGFFSRHSGSLVRRPVMVVAARTGTAARAAAVRREREPGRKVPLGDDIRSGMMYGLDADGEVVRVVRIR